MTVVDISQNRLAPLSLRQLGLSDYAHRYKRVYPLPGSIAKGYEDRNPHHKCLCLIVLMIVLLGLELYTVNYDPACRSYGCIIHNKNGFLRLDEST